MSSFLAFLQVLQILGSWSWAIISNLYIFSSLVFLYSIIDRLSDSFFRFPNLLEIVSVIYLAVLYHFKFRKKESNELKHDINIKNQNTVQIINNKDFNKD